MPRFKTGDRVQLVGDIAQFYGGIVGTIIEGGGYPASVLNQYTVRLVDGSVATFFDFQLQSPPAITAHILFDSSVSSKGAGTRGPGTVRQVRLLARDIYIHLRISGHATKTIVGEVMAGTVMRNALVTLLIGSQTADTTSTDDSGEFTLRDVVPGELTIEILVPSRRILASLTV
jgi:hypothetical protein